MSEWTVTSPSGTTEVTLTISDGMLSYTASAFGTRIIEPSALGIDRADASFTSDLTLVDAGADIEIDEVYTLVHGKVSEARHQAVERRIRFATAGGFHLDVVVRAADDGIAFRYIFPDEDLSLARVTAETTAFSIAGDGRAWLQATQVADYFSPAYENLYNNGVPVGLAAPVPSWNMPALFAIDGAWMLISESDTDAGYFGGHLSNRGTGATYSVVLPQVAEALGLGDHRPEGALPWTMPWRVIVVGRTAAELASSDLINALASAPSGDYSWVRPGRVSWSWWSEHQSPQDLDRLRDYIDLAADMGWEYSLVDANWNIAHTDEQMIDLVAYAAERGVGIFLWYNSGGPNNAVSEQPRDRMYDPAIRRAEFQKIAEWGVAGVKVDFFHSDKQEGIARYLAIADDAAVHHLLVNFHGSTIPRGWSRTRPNIMTMEGVRGAEQYGFDEAYPADAAWHNTVLAFSRNVVGPMDYTPVTFSDQAHPHTTTNAHELALGVVFESGLLHIADSAASIRSQTAAVRRVLSAMPAHWDDTRFLSGEPGRDVVVARRSGDDWYIAGLNGLEAHQSVTVDTSLIPADRPAVLYRDGEDPRSIVDSTITIGPDAKIDMAPRGGFVIWVPGPDS